MLDDSPTVPTLLTDHILKYICPADYYTLSTASVPIDDKGIHYNGPFGSLNNAVNFTHLTTSLNNRFQAARRSFSFNRGGSCGNRNNISSTNDSNNNNNNNDCLDSVAKHLAQKSSFDRSNAIIV